MQLVARQISAARPATTVRGGREEFTLAAGKRVHLRYWAPGETSVLDVTVPPGKQWVVMLAVEIVETDA